MSGHWVYSDICSTCKPPTASIGCTPETTIYRLRKARCPSRIHQMRTTSRRIVGTSRFASFWIKTAAPSLLCFRFRFFGYGQPSPGLLEFSLRFGSHILSVIRNPPVSAQRFCRNYGLLTIRWGRGNKAVLHSVRPDVLDVVGRFSGKKNTRKLTGSFMARKANAIIYPGISMSCATDVHNTRTIHRAAGAAVDNT